MLGPQIGRKLPHFIPVVGKGKLDEKINPEG
jgi:hypothetical protein